METDLRREHRACPKGPTRKLFKGRKDRAEAKVKRAVREACVERDGWCRIPMQRVLLGNRQDIGEVFHTPTIECQGEGEWAHMHVKRRSQTRGQAPEIRHTTKDSLMLCRFHHQEYDAHRLRITCLSRHGADGALKFTRAKA